MQLSATMCDTKTKEPRQNILRVLTQHEYLGPQEPGSLPYHKCPVSWRSRC